MRRAVRCTLLILLLISSACAPAPVPETATTRPSPLPSTVTSAPQTITFGTPDGASIEGTLYGSGKTAVIFSVMGNCKRGWEEIAKLVAEHEILALTYQWHGCRTAGGAVESELREFVDDLRAAIQFMRAQGVEKIILAGASLGGAASAKLAVESGTAGLIIVASPSEIEEWKFSIVPADVNIAVPKLFITAENDSVVDPSRTRELFDLAAEPKEWQTYPGAAHGTDIFETASDEAMQQRILGFILQIAAQR